MSRPKVGDKVKVIGGDYDGLILKVVELGEGKHRDYVLLVNNRWYHITLVKKV